MALVAVASITSGATSIYKNAESQSVYRESFMSLFEIASGDSWETVMYLMADVPAEQGQL